MARAWGKSWGFSWGNSWGSVEIKGGAINRRRIYPQNYVNQKIIEKQQKEKKEEKEIFLKRQNEQIIIAMVV